MKKRVSSTVTKRKPNPRPRKYASASERQAAYRARAPEVCFRAEPKTVETLDRIAETLDQSRADVLLSMTKFALANHDWARFGLTHKPLPFEYGVNPLKKMTKRQEVIEFGKRMGFKASAGKGFVYLTNMVGWGETFDDWDQAHAYLLKAYDDHYVNRTPYPWDYKENPMKTTRAKRTPTPAQLAARERFAEMARSGAFAKGRKRNPADAAPYTVTWKSTASGRMQTSNYRTKAEAVRDAQSLAAEGAKNVEVSKYSPATGAVAVEWRKKNPDNMGSYGPFYGDTDAPMTEAQIERRAESYMDRLDRQLMRNEITQTVYDREVKALNKWAKDQYAKRRRTNPTKKTVSQKISQLTREGYPQKQAVAIALNEERAGKVRRNPAPKRERMLNISWLTPGGEREVMSVPIAFTFTEYVGNVAERFFARLENGFLIVSEYSTGGRVGQVPHTMRAAALNDNAAAKQFTREMIQRVGPERFRAAIKKFSKIN